MPSGANAAPSTKPDTLPGAQRLIEQTAAILANATITDDPLNAKKTAFICHEAAAHYFITSIGLGARSAAALALGTT